jgi:hypothetical protein
MMYQKQEVLAMKSKNPAKIYLIENKIVSKLSATHDRGKKRG